ncbi:flavodoxin family protein [Halodesulfovibrio marinisediminis]|uniref:NADPH-dependent FMN reductase n=1 Tax=Halodesulfovibrio marinisediminis DSM 17456 TaxID=1121457 RepID=A0A1N6J5B5_9BACT|nr:flavodoxin family protein [Halodesulfovibrio marinisediminis]SIO39349.1 NADPH-dependent FMN reductase [Halodesulfovibrio marinisediminis DSM 17456]
MILGVEGSPRRGGNSDAMLKMFSAVSEQAGTPFYKAHLRDYRYEPCVGCERCRKDKICTKFNDGMTLLYPRIQEAKGLVLISPVHNYNVTAWVKGFIDRLYCFYDFTNSRPRGWSSRLAGQGRKAVIGAIAEQESMADMGMTLDAMRMPLEALGFEVVAELAVLNTFDAGGIKKNSDAVARIEDAAKKLVGSVSS